AAIADYLGLSQSDLQADLQGGKTLAQVATAQGKTVSGLEAAIFADAKSHLDAAVAAGAITAAQEAARPPGPQAHRDRLGHATGPPPGGPGGPGGGPGSAAIAAYLGLTQSDLRADLQSGKTLAQIATAQGKSVSGLEAAIVADAKTHLDAAVAAGKLTVTE